MTDRTAAAAELAQEQAHIDRAYAVLDAVREGADDVAGVTLDDDEAAGGTFQERFERERLTQDARRRAGELRWGDPPLVFGRIDRTDGERFHVGRLGVFADDHEPLVVDWRAPVAEPFYRATRVDPLGLRRRRSFHCRGRRLLGIDDDTFVELDAAGDDVLVGEAALLQSLAAPRSGRMGAHVATVQAEQDEVIRAPMAGITIVQGAAGTGKTVVALHRAAYLLYTYREVLDRQGVLLVGPNAGFLDYVRDVLPSLGEYEARLATVHDLFPGVVPVPESDEATAALKADLRMVRVVARAVRTRQRRLRDPARIPYGRFVLKLPAEQVNAVVDEVRGLSGTHNARRRFVEADLVAALHAEFRRRNTAKVDRMRDPGVDHFRRVLRATPAYRVLLQRIWPLLTPQELLHDLYGSAALVRVAAGGHLSEDERSRLHRDRSPSDADVAWTDADVPLLHEAFSLLGPLPRPPRPATEPTEDEQAIVDRVIDGVRASMELDMDAVMEADLRRSVLDEVRADLGTDAGSDAHALDLAEGGRPPVWGSVLVDEAQDVSPMAWRMVARSCPNQAMTIVGDLAQGTSPWSPSSWDEVVAWISPRHAPRRHELHINYRTPVEIMRLAAPFSAAPDQATAIRTSGVEPRIVSVDDEALVPAVLGTVADLRDAGRGTIGVVVPRALRRVVRAALADELRSAEGSLSVHTPDSAKGLEFDDVVVVEPAALRRQTRGEAALYIALTRATAGLVLVHAAPLPAELLDPSAASAPAASS